MKRTNEQILERKVRNFKRDLILLNKRFDSSESENRRLRVEVEKLKKEIDDLQSKLEDERNINMGNDL